MSQHQSESVLRSRATSAVGLFWGVFLSACGVFLLYEAWRELGQKVFWLGWVLGPACLVVGILLLFYRSTVTLDTAARTWQEDTRWLFVTKTVRGSFDDLDAIQVEAQQGKNRLYYTISLGGNTNGSVELIYDVVHSEAKMREILDRLQQATGLPVREREAT